MVGFSALVLTLNEESNLPRCLESLNEVDQVVVLDSGSTDGTIDIARRYGAEVVTRTFDDFAGQRNFAHDAVRFTSPWVFHLDADEALTPELVRACTDAARKDRSSGFFVPNKLIFEGRWLRFAGMYPTRQVRFVKPAEVRFVQHGHGQREAAAERGFGRIDEPYLHYNDSRGREEWIERHRRYARQECDQILAERSTADLTGLFSPTDPVRRRRAAKQLANRLPGRPTLRFLYMYVLRLGFLDGGPGLTYCRLLARYEAMIRDNLRAARGLNRR